MRFVGDDDEIAAIGERVIRFLELLNRREEDAVLLLLGEELPEMDAAFCLDRYLAYELLSSQ